MQTSVRSPQTQKGFISPHKIWIILVGVNQYKHPIPTLKYCANDCQELGTVLDKASQYFQEREIISLHDFSHQPGTLTSVVNSLRNLQNAKPGDTILFYFSGHCYLDKLARPVLCLADTEYKNLVATGLPLDKLIGYFESLDDINKIILLDTCHSGGLTLNPSKRAEQTLQKQVNKGSNFYIILSCEEEETSKEIPELKHGIVTYYLIEGIKGKAAENGLVKTHNLYEYLNESVKEYSFYCQQEHELAKANISNYQEKGGISLDDDNEDIISDTKQTPLYIVKTNQTDIVIGYATDIYRQALIINSRHKSKDTLELCNNLQNNGNFAVEYYYSENNDIEAKIDRFLKSETNEASLLYLAGELAKDKQQSYYKLKINRNTSILLSTLTKVLEKSSAKNKVVILDIWTEKRVDTLTKARRPALTNVQCFLVCFSQKKDAQPLLNQLTTTLKSQAQSQSKFSQMGLITKLTKWSRKESSIQFVHASPYGTPMIDIIVPGKQRINKGKFTRKECPFKGLKPFTKNDGEFYYGREKLTKEIISDLPHSNFITISGASGTGKSSLIQAGVCYGVEKDGLYNAQENKNVPCRTWIMRPGENPIDSLAFALKEDIEDIQVLRDADKFIFRLSQSSEELTSILVIDQFEEFFTLSNFSPLSKEENDHSKFLDLIIDTANRIPDRFKIIITIRSDFLSYCSEIPKLHRQVSNNLRLMPGYLTENGYRNIINKPAKRVGFTVEKTLTNELVKQISDEPNLLPLLELALQKVWEKCPNGELKLEAYQQIGELSHILQKQADDTYQKLNKQEQECAEWIFVNLISVEDNKKNTKCRRTLNDLANDKFDIEIISKTIKYLIDNRLIVVSHDDIKSGTELLDSSISVEIIHESLIKYWNKIYYFLDKYKAILDNDISQAYQKWINNNKDERYLSIGEILSQKAKGILRLYPDYISQNMKEFINECNRVNEDKESLLSFYQFKLKQASRHFKMSSNYILLLGAIGAGFACWTLLLSMYRNDKVINRVSFSPDNEIIAVTNRNEIIEVRNRQGDLLYSINGDQHPRASIAFSTFSNNGKILATTGENLTIKLWSREGELLHSFEGHEGTVSSIAFSYDDLTIASGSLDKTIKLWSREGELLHSLEGHKDWIYKIVFSPDGQIIASASWDGTIKLWSREGELLHSLEGYKGIINKLEFSQDSKMLISLHITNTKEMIITWNLKNEMLKSFENNQALFF